MKKAVAGITATGSLTLGNYIGAIKPMIDIQDEYELYIFVANLHALVLPIDAKELEANTKDVLKIYKAAGLDMNKVKLFKQSDVEEHSSLNWLLVTQTAVGELERMTQYKDKSLKQANGTELIPTGLLMYPVLQAADILLYKPEVVLVGEDQKQHLELARNIAERMNKRFGLNFPIPETKTPKVGARIMSLTDPTSKMSKSDTNKKSTIFLSDDEETINKKIKSAMTDDENKVYYDPENKPGVSNLLTIYASLANIDITEAEEIHKDMNYGEFKTSIANKIIEVLTPIREQFNSIDEIDYLSTEEVRKIAKETLTEVKKAMGVN